MFGWIWSLFDWLFSFGRANTKIVILGLDNAGKTTLLGVMKNNRVGTYDPTKHPQIAEMLIGSSRITAIDMGGHRAARRLWRDYCTGAGGIVFMVDASDLSRFQEAAFELDGLLRSSELEHTPVLILGNKIDDHRAVSEHELVEALGITERRCNKPRHTLERSVEVFMCSIVRKAGFVEGLRWLLRQVESSR